MVAGVSRDEQKEAVARVASKIFGVSITSANVIDERLKRSIDFKGEMKPEILRETILSGVPEEYSEFVKSPLAAWIEETFGIEREGDFFRRRVPITLAEGAEKLSALTELGKDKCEQAIRDMLQKGSRLRHPDSTPVFAVKLHQFISKGESVYATFDSSDRRQLTLSGQRYIRGENNREELLAPLVFCRVCGQEYYRVALNKDKETIEPRLPRDFTQEDDDSESNGFFTH